MEGERAFSQELSSLPNQEILAMDNSKIAYKYSIGGGFKTSKGWEPLGPAGFYNTFGPELSFGRTLQNKIEGNIAISKFTDSGSQINDWTPEGTKAVDRNLYSKFIGFVQQSISDLKARGHQVELAGIFYHVGENDMAYGPYRQNASKWLQSTINQSRLDLGLPNLKWFVSQQPPVEEKGLNRIDVTAQIESIASSDPAFFHLKAFNLPPQPEQLVLTSPAIVQLGELLAKGYLEHR